MIGSSLIPLLTAAGEHKITRLARPPSNRNNVNSHSIAWNPIDDKVNVKEVEGFDVVVHLLARIFLADGQIQKNRGY